jgi:hypothetical protein
VGATLEESLMTGLPRDELFVYEDALRQGQSVVVALVENAELLTRAREILARAGAETTDAARERWWLGLRSAEQERYTEGAAAFQRDEALYRRGFEASLTAETRGRTWVEALAGLRARHGADADAPAFRRGWERGQLHLRDLGYHSDLKKTA